MVKKVIKILINFLHVYYYIINKNSHETKLDIYIYISSWGIIFIILQERERKNQTPLKLIHVFKTRQVFVFVFFSIKYKNKHDKLRN